MLPKRGGVAIALLALATGALAQKAPHYPIQQFRLANGLHVVLSEDHSAPVIGLALAYDVGARDEVKGRTGFAHLFEHMMFQGSAHVGKFEHPHYIEAAGGVMNGFTREEDTTYIETVPSEKLPLILWLEADRMRSLAVNETNLENQRQVVEEEKRLRYDNQPYANALRVRLPELAYQNFNNQHSVIGSMADLDAASLADVQSFHKTYYAPNNATLVLVGDFDPKQARSLVAQYFGDIPSQPIPPRNDLTEPKQAAEKRDVYTDKLARVPALAIAWHGPSLNAPDSYPMELLSEILFGGESSRAYQELVKKRQLALNISGDLEAQRGPSLFTVTALHAPTVQSADLEKAIYAQIDAIKETPPTLDEVNRVKTSLLASRYRSSGTSGLESMLGRAIEIADDTVFQHDPNLINTEINRYLAVTPQQIQAVARKYFTAENRTVLEINAGAGKRASGGGGASAPKPGATATAGLKETR